MDKQLYDYLKTLNFDNEEIEGLCAQVPGLEIIDSERAFENIGAVVESGYPLIDIDSLIAINPGFLCYYPADLEKRLRSLGGDIEEKLKADPFLI